MAEDLYYQILESLRLYNLKGKFVSSVYDSPLNGSEAYILVELDIDSSRKAKDLANILELEKSTISRTVAGLVRLGYLKQKSSAQDRRHNELSLTKKGLEFLALHDQFNEKLIGEFVQNISLQEMSELQFYLKTLSDNDGAQPIVLRPNEHPMLIEMRRLARRWGAIGNSWFDSGYSIAQWQVLSEIKAGAGKSRPSELSATLSLPTNTISHILQIFENDGLIGRHRVPGDKRGWLLQLSTKGEKTLKQINLISHKRIRSALIELSPVQTERFSVLLRRYIGEEKSEVKASKEKVLQQMVIIRALEEDVERTEARGILILNLVRLNLYTAVPEILLGRDSLSYGLFSNEKIGSICEFNQRDGQWSINNFVTTSEYDQSELTREFLSECLRRFFNKTSAKKVELALGSHALRYLNDIVTKQSRVQNGLLQILSSDLGDF